MLFACRTGEAQREIEFLMTENIESRRQYKRTHPHAIAE